MSFPITKQRWARVANQTGSHVLDPKPGSGPTAILMFSDLNKLATFALACTRFSLTENFQPMWTTGRNITSCGFALAHTHVHTTRVNLPISMTELQIK